MKSNIGGRKIGALTSACCCCGLLAFFITSLLLLPYELFFVSSLIILYFLRILEKNITGNGIYKPLQKNNGKENSYQPEPLSDRHNGIVSGNNAHAVFQNTTPAFYDTAKKNEGTQNTPTAENDEKKPYPSDPVHEEYLVVQD